MTWMETPEIKSLEKFLDLTAHRHTLVASNLANIDTPGYRTRDIRFDEELQNAISGLSQDSDPQSYEVSGLIERPDGNNVSLDRETMLMAQTQLQFRIGIEVLRAQFHNLLTAINEGRQS